MNDTTQATETKETQEAPSIDNTLLGIPEIQLLVNYYHGEITRIKNDTSIPAFMKKMKLKPLQKEFSYIGVGMQGITRLLKLLETDPENQQHQADVNAIGEAFALRCQKLMLSRKLTNPRVQP